MRRRIVTGFAVVAILLALGIGLAPGLLSGLLAERLGRTMRTDVRLGRISWNPFRGRWTVRSVRVAADHGPAAFAARRVAVQFRVWDLIRGRHRLASTAIDRARVRLRATEDGWVLPLPARATAETPSDASSVFQLNAIEAPGAVIRLERPNGRRSLLHLRRLNVSASVGDGLRLTAWLRGRLDRAPISAVGRIETATSAQRVRVRLTASNVDVARTLALAAPTPARQIGGRADLRAKYEQSGSTGAVRQTVSGALAAHELLVGSGGVQGLRVRHARLPRFGADLGRQRLSLGTLRLRDPEVWVRRTGSQVQVAGVLGEAPREPTPAWETTVAGIEVAGGTVHHVDAATGEEALTLALEEVHVGAIDAADAPVPVSVTATVGSGGRIVAQGELIRDPPRGRGRIELTAVKLPSLATLVGSPVQLESGQVTGALELALTGGVVDGSGTLTVSDVKTLAPPDARPEDVMAFKEARLTLRRVRTEPPSATLEALEVDWPYVLVDRSPGGIFPLSLATSTAPAPSSHGPLAVRIGRLHVLGGRIDFRDTTLEPPYWRSLAELELDARRVEGPTLRMGTLRAKGMVDEISPLRVEGTVGERTRLHADVERLDLLPFNAYLQGASPYTVKSGAISGRSDITLDRSQLEVNNEVVLSRLGLSGTEDEDFVKREVGVPLTLALALMKDYRGDIALALPFGGDLKEPTFEMRSVILQSVVRAIRGAVLSPLNALGRVLLRDGRIDEIALEAVPFPPAARRLDETGRQRVQQVARVLESHPDLAVRLRGLAASADVERIQDEAALAALVDTPPNDPVRAYVEARLAGRTPGVLDARQQARLDALRAGLPWPGEQLHELARDRGTVTMAALVVDHRIDPQRVSAEQPDVPGPDQLAPVAGASVELHGR